MLVFASPGPATPMTFAPALAPAASVPADTRADFPLHPARVHNAPAMSTIAAPSSDVPETLPRGHARPATVAHTPSPPPQAFDLLVPATPGAGPEPAGGLVPWTPAAGTTARVHTVPANAADTPNYPTHALSLHSMAANGAVPGLAGVLLPRTPSADKIPRVLPATVAPSLQEAAMTLAAQNPKRPGLKKETELSAAYGKHLKAAVEQLLPRMAFPAKGGCPKDPNTPGKILLHLSRYATQL